MQFFLPTYKLRYTTFVLNNNTKDSILGVTPQEIEAFLFYTTSSLTPQPSFILSFIFCSNMVMNGLAKYYYAANNHEREHLLELYKYLNTYGGASHLKPLKDTTVKT